MIRIKNIIEDDKVVERRLVRTNYRQSKPSGKGPWLPPVQELTDERFMSASQKRAFRNGEKIYV